MLVRRPRRPRDRPRRALCALLIAAALGLIGYGMSSLDPGLLHLAPALLLFAVLLARRYPGERHVTRLAARRRRRHPRRKTRVATPRTLAVLAPPRGGLLLASAMGERAPPALAPR